METLIIAILNSTSKFLLPNTGREEQGDRGGGAERGGAEAQDGGGAGGRQPQQSRDGRAVPGGRGLLGEAALADADHHNPGGAQVHDHHVQRQGHPAGTIHRCTLRASRKSLV